MKGNVGIRVDRYVSRLIDVLAKEPPSNYIRLVVNQLRLVLKVVRRGR